MAVPSDVLVEVLLQVAGLEEPDVGAEALDGADAGERGDERLGHAGLDEVAGLGDVGEVAGPGLERDVEQLGAERRRCAAPARPRWPARGACVRGET